MFDSSTFHDEFPLNFDALSVDDVSGANDKRKETESKKDSISIDYTITGVAPLEFWTEIPELRSNDPTFTLFLDLVHTIHESHELLAQLPEEIAQIIEQISTMEMGSSSHTKKINLENGRTIEVSIPLEKMMNNRFCHELLFFLVHLGYSEESSGDVAIAQLVRQIYAELRDQLQFLAKDLSIEGRLIPVDNSIKIVVGASDWGIKTRKFFIDDHEAEARILDVPDRNSPQAQDGIYKIATLFAKTKNFELPEEQLMWAMLENPDENTEEQFAYLERYITKYQGELQMIVDFISWAEEDPRTAKLVEKLKQEYVSYVEIELGNLSLEMFGSSQLDKIANVPLPHFEEPTRNGRATAHLGLEEHIESIKRDSHRTSRSSSELKKEIEDFLYAPFRSHFEEDADKS